jgi:hypothetical protein
MEYSERLFEVSIVSSVMVRTDVVPPSESMTHSKTWNLECHYGDILAWDQTQRAVMRGGTFMMPLAKDLPTYFLVAHVQGHGRQALVGSGLVVRCAPRLFYWLSDLVAVLVVVVVAAAAS